MRVEAIQSGGGQERGLRSGTLPAPLVVGIGEACAIAQKEMSYDHAYITKLSNHLISEIFGKLTHVIRNGDPTHSYPGCVNLSFAYVEGKCNCFFLSPFIRDINQNEFVFFSSFRKFYNFRNEFL